MPQILQLLQGKSWKQAFGEVALIFIGISMALGADAWYGRIQDRSDEAELLGQLLGTLDADLESIRQLHTDVLEKRRLFEELLAHIDEGNPYNTALDRNFGAVRTWQTLRINKAPYEALKMRGLGLVSDLSLRVDLIEYYDSIVPWVEDRDSIDRFEVQNYAEPYYQLRFETTGDGFNTRPTDYDGIIADLEFRNILKLRYGVHSGLTVPAYEELLAKTISLTDQIETHLDSLN